MGYGGSQPIKILCLALHFRSTGYQVNSNHCAYYQMCFSHTPFYCARLFEVVVAAVILQWTTCRALKIDLLAEI